MKPTDVQNLLQITALIPELLELVDTKKLAIAAAVLLSSLDTNAQQMVFSGTRKAALSTSATRGRCEMLLEKGS